MIVGMMGGKFPKNLINFRMFSSGEEALVGDESAFVRCPPVSQANPEDRIGISALLRSAAPPRR
jgi:hypothetical protein